MAAAQDPGARAYPYAPQSVQLHPTSSTEGAMDQPASEDPPAYSSYKDAATMRTAVVRVKKEASWNPHLRDLKPDSMSEEKFSQFLTFVLKHPCLRAVEENDQSIMSTNLLMDVRSRFYHVSHCALIPTCCVP